MKLVKKLDNNGFHVLDVILFIVVVGVISFVGYRLLHITHASTGNGLTENLSGTFSSSSSTCNASGYNSGKILSSAYYCHYEYTPTSSGTLSVTLHLANASGEAALVLGNGYGQALSPNSSSPQSNLFKQTSNGTCVSLSYNAQAGYLYVITVADTFNAGKSSFVNDNFNGSISVGSSVDNGCLKAPIQGLIDRSGPPPLAYQSLIHSYVVQVNWKDLQTTENGPIVTNNAIDAAIAVAKKNNYELKIRVYGGVFAPDWAKSIGGSPINITNSQSGQAGTVGRFWTDAYGQAYQTFQNKLAAKYDRVGVVHEIVVARCMTFYDEPFLSDLSGINATQNIANLVAAGFTVAQDQNCIEQQLNESQAFKHTLIDLSFNPYQELNSKNTGTSPNEAFTYSVMQYCRKLLGNQCVIENNSIDNARDTASGDYSTMYSQMQSIGGPLAFQTASINKIKNLLTVLQFAKTEGANSVELPQGYSTYSTSQLSSAF